MAYIGKEPASGIRNRFIFTATAGQTTFSGTDDHNRTLSYTDAEFTDVFLNGIKLDKSDYTATSGTSIVLDEGAAVDDTLEVINFDTFSVFSGEFSQDLTVGGTVTADGLTVDTDTLYVDSTNNLVGIGTNLPAAKIDVRTVAGTSAQMNLYSGNNTTVSKISLGQLGSVDWDLGIAATTGNFKIGGLGGAVEEAYKAVRSGTAISYQTWNTGGSERMRIDINGRLLAGRTSTSSRESALSGAGSIFSNDNIFVGNSSGTSGRIVRLDGFNDSLYIQWDSGTAPVGGVKLDYGATSFVSASDERLKENIQSLNTGNAYDFVKTVRATTFEWKTDAVDGTHIGFIAQDWEQQYPELISSNELTRVTTDDGDEAAKGLMYSETVVVLTAALQEAITKIETLETKVAALEAN